jgi:hypothetical protein
MRNRNTLSCLAQPPRVLHGANHAQACEAGDDLQAISPDLTTRTR